MPSSGRAVHPRARLKRPVDPSELLLSGRYRRELLQAGHALVGGADGRELALLEAAVGAEALRPGLAAAGQSDERSLAHLALAEAHAEVALHELERLGRGGEEALVPAPADPERAADAAGDEEHVRAALVEPRTGHRAELLLERLRAALGMLGESEDRLRVDRHLRMRALETVPLEDLLVVEDDPVVDAHDGAVTDGVVVRLDRRMALRVVANVDQRLARLERKLEALEQGARARPLLVAADAAVAGRAVGVARRVGAALGDSCEEGLRGERAVDARLRAQAVSGDATHDDVILRTSSDGIPPRLTPLWSSRGSDEPPERKLVDMRSIPPSSTSGAKAVVLSRPISGARWSRGRSQSPSPPHPGPTTEPSRSWGSCRSATWSVRQATTRTLADQGGTIRLPVHAGEQVRRVLRARRVVAHELNRDPTIVELATESGFPVRRVEELLELVEHQVGPETPVGD